MRSESLLTGRLGGKPRRYGLGVTRGRGLRSGRRRGQFAYGLADPVKAVYGVAGGGRGGETAQQYLIRGCDLGPEVARWNRASAISNRQAAPPVTTSDQKNSPARSERQSTSWTISVASAVATNSVLAFTSCWYGSRTLVRHCRG